MSLKMLLKSEQKLLKTFLISGFRVTKLFEEL